MFELIFVCAVTILFFDMLKNMLEFPRQDNHANFITYCFDIMHISQLAKYPKSISITHTEESESFQKNNHPTNNKIYSLFLKPFIEIIQLYTPTLRPQSAMNPRMQPDCIADIKHNRAYKIDHSICNKTSFRHKFRL